MYLYKYTFCLNIFEHIRMCTRKSVFVLSGPDIWRTQFEKRNVKGNPGGIAILTCQSDVLGERGDRQTEPLSS